MHWRQSTFSSGQLNLAFSARAAQAPDRENRGLSTPSRWRQTPLLGWIMVVEIATLSYLWGAAPGCPRGCVTSIISRCMPRAGLRRSPSCSARVKVSGRRAARQNASGTGTGAVCGGRGDDGAVRGHADAQPSVCGWRCLCFRLMSSGATGAAIPAVIQHHAAREAVGSAYGIINGIGNICAAFIPLLMGMVMRSVGSVSSGFSVLVVSQVVTLLAGECCCCMRRAAAISA